MLTLFSVTISQLRIASRVDSREGCRTSRRFNDVVDRLPGKRLTFNKDSKAHTSLNLDGC